MTTATTDRPFEPPPAARRAAGAARRLPPWAPRAAVAGVAVAAVGAAFVLPMREGSDDRAATAPSITPFVPAPSEAQGRSAPVRLPAPLSVGQATVEAGPFTDRLRFSDLAVHPGTSRPAVSGVVELVADVSPLMVLELRADLYDASGALVGTTSRILRQVDVVRAKGGRIEGPPEPVPFEIPAADAPTAVAAVLSVPALVQE